MKKTLLALPIILLSFSSFAQPKKSDFFVGLSLANNTSNSIGTVYTQPYINGIVPKGGYFLTRNIAVGASIMSGGEYSNDNRFKYNFHVTPFARYYFRKRQEKENKKLFWFLEATGGYGMNYEKNDGPIPGSKRVNTLVYGAGVGVNYYLTQRLSLESVLKSIEQNRTVSGNTRTRHISFEVGVQYLLNKSKTK